MNRRTRSFGCGVCALAILMLLCSCASVGRKFPVSPVSEILIGETKDAEIREMFGEPWRVGVEDGRRTWTYGDYAHSRAQKRLRVFSLSDASNIINILPKEVILERLTYQFASGKLVMTGGAGFRFELTESGSEF
ncbi:MAG: hypothetical protein ABIK85_06365 [Candidatus Eisenbacteria bacterium]